MWVLSCVKKTFTQQQWSFLGLKELFNLKDTQCYTVFSASEVMQGKSINSTAVEFPWAKSICCIGKIYNVMPSSTQVKYFFVLGRYTVLCHLKRKWSDARKGHSLHSSHPLKQRSLARPSSQAKNTFQNLRAKQRCFSQVPGAGRYLTFEIWNKCWRKLIYKDEK